MIVLLELLQERISDVVYRSVPGTTALRNLKYNELQLTPEFTPSSTDSKFQKGKLFYLSTSRTTMNSYIQDSVTNNQVLYVLDGRKLAQNYKGVPVNYFGKSKVDTSQFEAEDRILSNKAVIKPASKYIKEIHVINMGFHADELLKIKEYAEKLRLPIYFYKDWSAEADFITMRKNKSVPFETLGITTHGSKDDNSISNQMGQHLKNSSFIYQLMNFYKSNNPDDIDMLDIKKYFVSIDGYHKSGAGPFYKSLIKEFINRIESDVRVFRKVREHMLAVQEFAKAARKFKSIENFIIYLADKYVKTK